MQRCFCDLCGKELIAGADSRYLVRMEARMVAEPVVLTAADLDGQDDPDHIDAMDELLAGMDEDTELEPPPPAPPARAFDLCVDCFRRFHADPLGLDRTRKLHFSSN
jgi:hypothetical protein